MAVLPVFLVIATGIFLRRRQWLTAEADTSLLKIVINLLIPALIFVSITQNPALKSPSNFLLAPLIGFLTVAGGMGLGFLVAPVIGLKERKGAATFALCVGLYNYGYIPIPLAEMLYDRRTVGVLLVHNLGVEAALWTVGLALLGTRSNPGKSKWMLLLNPPVLAILLALGLNLLGWDQLLPRFITVTASMLGQCAIPLGLLLAGATLADYLPEYHPGHGWDQISGGVLLRLGLLPIIFLLLAKWLPISIELKRVMVLQAAMPSAIFPIVLARHYQGDPAVALRVVIATTALGIITVPLWIRAGTWWVLQ